MTVVAALVLGAVLGFGALEAGATGETRFADFIYADANEGSASGGHVAIRLGDRTYHFGYHEPGVLRLDRDDSARFAHVYGALENRNLQLLRVAVTEQTFDRLRSSFNERYLSESGEFEVLAALALDRAFLESWTAGTPAAAIRGAGYFLPDGRERPPPHAGGALARLRERVRERHGAGFLRSRRGEAEKELVVVSGSSEPAVAGLSAPGAHPARGYGPARRAVDAQALVEALGVLERGALLRPGTTLALSADELSLDASTRSMLSVLAERLERDLVDAAASRRPDIGFVLLVGMARLLALEATLDGDHLVILDVFPPGASRLSVAEVEARGGRLDVLAAAAHEELRRVRDVLAAKPVPRESDYAALEAVANRYHELERSRRTGTDLRVAPGQLLPVRSAVRVLELPQAPTRARLVSWIEVLQERERELLERLDRAHHYNLLTHNCVSELFAQIERAVSSDPVGVVRSSVAQLGGHVPPGRGLEFIPFLATDAVASAYRVDRVETLPSYRLRRVEEMEIAEGGVVAWRESNVLTSTVYESSSLDSAFLFFTDDVVLARPLLGVANLLYGLGATVAGVPLAAVDGGRTLSAGLRGALWSLPELAFVNVRKGSFFYLPRDQTDLPSERRTP